MSSIITAEKSIYIDKDLEVVWNIISDVNSWGKWNPSIDHAVLYGQFEKGSKLKLVSGKWDFDCVIGGINEGKNLAIFCKTMGLVVNLDWDLKIKSPNSEIKLIVSAEGFLVSLIRKRTMELVDGILESTLTSLKFRAEKVPES